MSAGAASSTKCRSCGASITWCITPAGKLHPLDDGRATIVVLDPPLVPGEPPIGRVVTGQRSHFSTCPNADQHRRPR